MTELNSQDLKKNFHQDIIELYKKITKIVKYKPTRLMDYINKYGGYEAAVKYITTESNVQDFAVLWESERLDLSVEALITCEKYRDLFDEEVVAYCDRKLKEYSYAPNKIEEVQEPSGYVDEEEEGKIDIEAFLKQKELLMPKLIKKDYKIYKYAVGITKEDWKTMLLDPKIVTASNLDCLLRIYSIGDEVGPAELSKEKGFSSNYPYKEVMMALGKRIKTAMKVEVPAGEDQKPMWWQLLFNGGFKDNSCFEWSLKNELRRAIDELVAEGKVEKVEVASEKSLVALSEEAPVKIAPKEASSSGKKEDGLSAFDRLFASIMSDEPAASTTRSAQAEAKEKQPEPVAAAPTLKTSEPSLSAQSLASQKVAEEPKPIEAMETAKCQEPVETAEVPGALQPEEMDAAAKKAACIDYYGAICDLCGFDYGYTYGEAFENMIEVHNIHAQGDQEILPDTDPVKDLIPICSNCHKVIHSQTPPISTDQMRKMIKA